MRGEKSCVGIRASGGEENEGLWRGVKRGRREGKVWGKGKRGKGGDAGVFG